MGTKDDLVKIYKIHGHNFSFIMIHNSILVKAQLIMEVKAQTSSQITHKINSDAGTVWQKNCHLVVKLRGNRVHNG
jgi:hypothetical protein